MNDTPITDKLKWNLIAGGIDPKNDVVFARDCADMETLLEQLANKHREALDRIKRLEEAGNQLKDRYILENENWDLQTVNDWNEAKEDKL